MKSSAVGLLLFVLCTNSWGQDYPRVSTWNLHLNLGASIVTGDFASGPALGLELINSENRFSFAYRGDYPFTIGTGSQLGDYHVRILEYHSQQYIEVKYNSVQPHRSLLSGSLGVCWLSTNDDLGLHHGDMLLTAAISYPFYWLRCELRYNLLPNELSSGSTFLSHFSMSAIYRFKPFIRN